MKIFIRISLIVSLLFVFGCTVNINPEAKMRVETNDNVLIPNSGSFDFGLGYVNANKNALFQISNEGKKTLVLGGNPNLITISGSNANDFIIDESTLNSKIGFNKSSLFTITFHPQTIGHKTATIQIINNDAEFPFYTFNIYGNSISPEIEVKQGNTSLISGTSIYDFKEICVGCTSIEIQFTISNNGSGFLHLSGTPNKISITGNNADEFEINQTNTSESIEPGSSTYFTVSFASKSIGSKSAKISITNNDIDENPFTFTLKGLAIDPGIIILDSAQNAIINESGIHDFGEILRNTTAQETFTINNLGNSNLELIGNPRVMITGSDANNFSLISQPTSIITPGNSTTFIVSFTPNLSVDYSATIYIENNDLLDNPYKFTIKGKGVEPEINILDPYNNIIVSGSGSYNYGSMLVNTPLNQSFMIQNLGAYNLILNGTPTVSITGSGANAFSIINTPYSTISPSSSSSLTIAFNPTTEGSFAAIVSIKNNDFNENPYKFTLYGIGSKPEINVKQGSINIPNSTGNYRFGCTRIGYSSQPVSFTIENLGLIKLKLTGSPIINLFGTNSSEFSLNSSSTTSEIAPSANTTFTITFKPTSIGDKTATISIANNDADENPYIFKIIGKGVILNYGWTKKMGGITSDAIRDSLTDSSGNIYLIGDFANTVDFGADFGVSDSKTAVYSKDVFVMKINANGTYGWTKTIGGIHNEIGYSITLDSSGYLYITGEFETTVDFGADFGVSDSKTSNGNSDIFITKLSTNGAYGWTKTFGSSYDDSGYGISLDSSGNIFVTGCFQGTINFGADFGVTDSKTAPNSSDDIYVTKINANGTYGWTKRLGGSDNDIGKSITIDTTGNIFVTGIFRNTVDFGEDFGVSDSKSAINANDIFITKINANGTYGWTKVMGGSSDDEARGILTDSSGNIFVTGFFGSNTDFGKDFGVSDNKTNMGSYDIFLMRINSNGTYGWTKSIGGSKYDYANSIAMDSYGNLYIVGAFQETVNFGADFGISDSKTAIGYDIYATRINANGTYCWTMTINGASNNSANSITLDASNNIYISGLFYNTLNFGAYFGITDNKVSAGNIDTSITKITQQ